MAASIIAFTIKTEGSWTDVERLIDNVSAKLHKAKIEAGVLPPEAERTYVKPNGKAGPTVAQVARWNEFGTVLEVDGVERQHVPPRPFMRRASQYGRRAVITEMSVATRTAWRRDVLQGNPDGYDRALRAIAKTMARQIHRQLQTTMQWATPNSQRWARKKGHGHQLHHTEQLAYSISGVSYSPAGKELSRDKV